MAFSARSDPMTTHHIIPTPARIIDGDAPEPARPRPHVFWPLLTFAFGLWALAVVCAVAAFAARGIAGW